MAGLRVLACVKRVPAPGAQITLTADARAIDARNLSFTTSPHEECAVEEGIRLVETHGGDLTVLTVGPAEAEEQLRFAVSVGAQHAVLVTTEATAAGEDPDPQATAHAITDAVRALEADGRAFDLVLFGNESADAGGFQVGVRVARALGRPIVNGIKAIEIGDVAVTARRRRSSTCSSSWGSRDPARRRSGGPDGRRSSRGRSRAGGRSRMSMQSGADPEARTVDDRLAGVRGPEVAAA